MRLKRGKVADANSRGCFTTEGRRDNLTLLQTPPCSIGWNARVVLFERLFGLVDA
jgi:hypothetical protein